MVCHFIQVKCYNCQKICHYSIKYPESPKKLVLILVTFVPMIEASKEGEVILRKVLYIHYLLHFRKNKENEIWALINLSNNINAITLGFAAKIGPKIHPTNIRA